MKAALAVALVAALALASADTPYQAAAQVAPVTMLAVGSCNKHTDLSQPIFDAARTVGAQAWVWLGDVVYGDVRVLPFYWAPAPIPEKQARYDALKYRSDYVALRSAMPVYGIYDDHDFGINNGGRDYADREVAKQLFLDFLDEPRDSPRRQQPGVYASYTFGAGNEKVKLLLLDNRYNRDPTETGRTGGDMLGEQQWKWLERELTDSDAAVHLIANGIQVLPREKPIQEKWAEFPATRTRLFELIAAKRVPGVILLSGDIHYAELLSSECVPTAYPLWELTTSGMSHSCESQVPFGLCSRFVDGLMADSSRVTYYGDLNFATIEFDWSKRAVTLSVRRPDASVAFSKTLQLNAMQPAAPNTPVPAGWSADPTHCPPVAEWRLYKERTWILVGRGVAALLLVITLWLCYRAYGCCRGAVGAGGRDAHGHAYAPVKDETKTD